MRLSPIGVFGTAIYATDDPERASEFWNLKDVTRSEIRTMLQLTMCLGRVKVRGEIFYERVLGFACYFTDTSRHHRFTNRARATLTSAESLKASFFF